MPRQPEKREDAVDELVDALREFTVVSDVFVEGFARQHGLGRSDMNAIMWISTSASNGQPITIGELAVKLNIGPPAVTALVDRLQASGHVRRMRDPLDRRRVTIVMEPMARHLAVEYFVPLGRRMTEAVADRTDEDLRIAAEVVRRMITAVTG